MSFPIHVNGVAHDVPDERRGDMLIDYLHDDLKLTGSKFCCGIGVCRACTVSVLRGPSGVAEPVISCSTPLELLEGSKITTIEGVAQDGALSPIQAAFLEHFSFQCGYCAPGFVMAAEILMEQLRRQPVPEDQIDGMIAEAIGSHICRCTGYVRYVQAIKAVAIDMMGKTDDQ